MERIEVANPREQSFLISNAFASMKGLSLSLSLSLSRSLSLPLFLLAQIEGPVGIVIARWNPVCFFIMSAPSTVYSPKPVSLHSLSISNESLFKNYNLLSLFIIKTYTLDSSLYSILLIFLF